jgi:anti-sigma factor RsiW
MNCVEWEERIALHAGGDLAPGESAEVERHLAGCPACHEFWTGLCGTLNILRDEHRAGIDPAHFTAVRSNVIAEIERGRKTWRRLAWVSGVGIAAALMIGLALRPAPLPAPPLRVAVRIPSVPLTPRAEKPANSRLQAKSLPHKGQPVLIKLQTDDPKIVIYWIAD